MCSYIYNLYASKASDLKSSNRSSYQLAFLFDMIALVTIGSNLLIRMSLNRPVVDVLDTDTDIQSQAYKRGTPSHATRKRKPAPRIRLPTTWKRRNPTCFVPDDGRPLVERFSTCYRITACSRSIIPTIAFSKTPFVRVLSKLFFV